MIKLGLRGADLRGHLRGRRYAECMRDLRQIGPQVGRRSQIRPVGRLPLQEGLHLAGSISCTTADLALGTLPIGTRSSSSSGRHPRRPLAEGFLGHAVGGVEEHASGLSDARSTADVCHPVTISVALRAAGSSRLRGHRFLAAKPARSRIRSSPRCAHHVFGHRCSLRGQSDPTGSADDQPDLHVLLDTLLLLSIMCGRA